MRWPALIAVAAALVTIDASSAPPASKLEDPVIVSVGKSDVRASELGHYLAKLHEFERESFGKTPLESRRGYVERRLIPELLLAEHARALGLTERPEVASRLQRALADALKTQIQTEIDGKLTTKELREYCRRGGDRSDAECDRDVWSHRVALRRTKAHAEVAARTKALEARLVRGVDRSLLDRLTVTPRGEISALPPASSAEGAQP